MSTSADTEFFGAVLAASAYRAGDRIAQLRDLLKVLHVVHIFRDPDAGDVRCRTCRDSSARPAPFPCATHLLVRAAIGGDDQPIEDTIGLRNAGRILNGLNPLPDSGLRRELGPLLQFIHDAYGFEWADPERLPL